MYTLQRNILCFQLTTHVNIIFFQVAKCAIKVELVNDSYTELKGEIAGPPDTPYEGGNFVLEIRVPETYPFNPPKVKFEVSCCKHVVLSLLQKYCLSAYG